MAAASLRGSHRPHEQIRRLREIPHGTTRSATAREPSPAKIMIKPAVRVMPEHIAVGPPVAP